MEDIAEVIDFLRASLSSEELVQVIQIILALSKPSAHSYDGLYNILGEKGLGEDIL